MASQEVALLSLLLLGCSAARPGEDPGPAPGGRSGEIVVRVAAPLFREGETVRATVVNGSGEPILAEDQQTDCTIATLERSAGAGWESLIACGQGRPPVQVTIEPGQSANLTIDPRSVNFGAGPGDPLGFGPGTYRLRFTYRLVPGAEPAGEAVSATFRVER